MTPKRSDILVRESVIRENTERIEFFRKRLQWYGSKSELEFLLERIQMLEKDIAYQVRMIIEAE